MVSTAPENGPAPLVVTLFGPMQVSVDGKPLPSLRSRKSLWLLALLTLRGGRPVEREWLASNLWPDAYGDRAFANLRVALSELRKAMGAQGSLLQSPDRHTIVLDLTGTDVDVLAFDAAMASETPPSLARAAALYTAPLLEGCAEEWVVQERSVREQGCLHALYTLAEAALAAGECSRAIAHYQRAVSLDPFQDSAQRGLMEARSRSGDINAALEVYQAFARHLRRDDPRAMPDEKTSALYGRLRKEVRLRAHTQVRAAMAGSEKAPPPIPAVSGYLPHPLTDLVGREEECLEVAAKLRRARLVTLTGPGGIGKTRLALEVASEAAPGFADGVWLVALEALADSERVAGQVAGVLGLKEEPRRSSLECVTARLHGESALLVLDNCEHVLTACAHLALHLLQECAGVRILATSREPLGITGETAWAVPALSAPDPAHLPANRATLVRVLAGYEGVQLFVERAQAVRKTFALTGDNALAVAQICARLEGMPLAIELAAVRVKAMTVLEIAARIDDHLGLLAEGSRAGPSRQQTLRATLDWSYSLLTEPECLLLGRLSVFAGGWTLEAAKQVAAGSGIAADEVLVLLEFLVDKSLVVFGEPERGGRYRLLETVRQYVAEKLGAEAEWATTRHRDWCVAFAEEAEPCLRGAAQDLWLQRLETEHDNLRAALTASAAQPQGAIAGLRMSGALGRFWLIRSHFSEGRKYLQNALGRSEVQELSALRAKAVNWAGVLCASQGEHAAARKLFEECLSIEKHRQDHRAIAGTLGNLANVALNQGDYVLAGSLFEESLGVFREVGSQRGIAASLGNLGNVAYIRGDLALAQALHHEGLSIFQELNDRQGIAWTLNALGNVSCQQKEYGPAWTLHEDGLSIFQELKDKQGISASLHSIGNVALAQGNPISARVSYAKSLCLRLETGDKEGVAESLLDIGTVLLVQSQADRAVRLWCASHKLRKTLGSSLPPNRSEQHSHLLRTARKVLGAEAFEVAWEEGNALTWEQATAYALEGIHSGFSPEPSRLLS